MDKQPPSVPAMDMQSSIQIAQISDCHLYGDIDSLHFGANVYRNLETVFSYLARMAELKLVVFTGDLSQDHSIASYQRFNELVAAAKLPCPVAYVPGNHDDRQLLKQQLTATCITHEQTIHLDEWQILLVDSKSVTPSGEVNSSQRRRIEALTEQPSLVFMHHHPMDVGYFIDRHGLNNKQQFWQSVASAPKIRAIACGHVHRGEEYHYNDVTVFTCPATSIMFARHPNDLLAESTRPGLRLFDLGANDVINSRLVYL
ncbi:metallophosphoesterase [Thalassotalea maritima]|uniref:metallophosphoesterase n=1 Tax=Thalassotalea maritima TaxID=3242416 RepID=UPI003526F53C